MRLIKPLLAALALAVLAGCATAPVPGPTPAKSAQVVSTEIKSMLWLGNSFFYYNNSMHGHVSQLLSAAGAKNMRSSSATISGSGINWHDLEAHFKPGGVASYSFVGDNEVRFNTFDKPFDGVMMMDCSQCPIHPQLQSIFHEYAAKHSATARSHGAAPIFFMSWAYQDKPEMTQQLAIEYIKAGKQNKALVVPAGLAFATSLAKRPELTLHVADKRHPTLAGTYLAACTVLASVYKINPVGLSYTAGLPIDVAAHLQVTAWETSQAFHAKEGRGSL
ncbi:hypothetical protein LNV23_06385 [Paucibacter sp. DJ1R-11]|uniref:hypothetical protein n=1 Tax=Paucibacter sp. DJ1R-11 TaxID=2893556 RepID=UPI0021E49C40|nr:hypothetical protein [Paucibacter sp. DJ1R-11]MCV2363082.1 hypothetical protein [Paucibacter sp. DJ1R-11]